MKIGGLPPIAGEAISRAFITPFVQSLNKARRPSCSKWRSFVKNVGYSLPPHWLHGNTIRETVAFIGTGGVELKARLKRLTALGKDENARIAFQLANGFNGSATQPKTTSEKRKELTENLIGRDESPTG